MTEQRKRTGISYSSWHSFLRYTPYSPATLASTTNCQLLTPPRPDEFIKCVFEFKMHLWLSVDRIPRLFARELIASEAKATAVAFARYCKPFKIWKEEGGNCESLTGVNFV